MLSRMVVESEERTHCLSIHFTWLEQNIMLASNKRATGTGRRHTVYFFAVHYPFLGRI